ncbi:hypothetical protein BKA56DRAFT_156238 [Ilyonectria sp. MPI-CAGE-AT-0026]|nr:hypothetical protein BKA56DRAFT_156238 [Ilyonectria sp. MPI-CAGE-AT-0026]
MDCKIEPTRHQNITVAWPNGRLTTNQEIVGSSPTVTSLFALSRVCGIPTVVSLFSSTHMAVSQHNMKTRRRRPTNDMVAWPNGKASDYESGDCGFDPHRDLSFCFIKMLWDIHYDVSFFSISVALSLHNIE